jgi:hypothetical protein
MSRARWDAEALEMVAEIQKNVASLARRVTRLSRARSTSQAANEMDEWGGFRG